MVQFHSFEILKEKVELSFGRSNTLKYTANEEIKNKVLGTCFSFQCCTWRSLCLVCFLFTSTIAIVLITKLSEKPGEPIQVTASDDNA